MDGEDLVWQKGNAQSTTRTTASYASGEKNE
jgi:hypothetical protein